MNSLCVATWNLNNLSPNGERAKACRAKMAVDRLVVFPNAAFRNDPLDPRISYEYHKAIADATGMPIILFQLAPVFGGVYYNREALLRLLEIPEVVAIRGIV